jgi:hypothetical protein
MDLQLQMIVINIAINTLLEYGFYIVSYTKQKLVLDRKNKKLAKRLMKILIKCPSSLIFIERKKERLGIRKL